MIRWLLNIKSRARIKCTRSRSFLPSSQSISWRICICSVTPVCCRCIAAACTSGGKASTADVGPLVPESVRLVRRVARDLAVFSWPVSEPNRGITNCVTGADTPQRKGNAAKYYWSPGVIVPRHYLTATYDARISRQLAPEAAFIRKIK
jgi:hypothetical protein